MPCVVEARFRLLPEDEILAGKGICRESASGRFIPRPKAGDEALRVSMRRVRVAWHFRHFHRRHIVSASPLIAQD